MFLMFLESIFFASISTAVLFYALFLSILYYYKRRNKSEVSLDFFYPKISMIIPIFNEGKIIRNKIENLLKMDYPRSNLEVIFVDGGSIDDTAEIISKYKVNHSFINLVEQGSRRGYNAAVFDGFRKSTGEIIVITQADAIYEADALKYLVRHFKDPEVGAVTGKQLLSNKNVGLVTELESSYRGFYDFVRVAETQMDSPFDIKGEICALRRDICENLLSDNPKLQTVACVDCCLSCQARLEGYRTVFEPKARYYERVTSTMTDRLKQQIRRGTILIESLLLYKNMLFNRKYGLFGLIILPAHLFILAVVPWLVVLGSITFPFIFVNYPSIFLVFLAIIVISSIARPVFFLSFFQSQVALAIATVRVVTGRDSQMIEQLPSTRE